MVGRFSGAVHRIESLLKPNVYRVRCDAHQPVPAVQSAFNLSLRSEFHAVLHSLISYLRMQVNFQPAIGSVFQKEATKRWLYTFFCR